MQQTVELSKAERLKQLNQKLNQRLAEKKKDLPAAQATPELPAVPVKTAEPDNSQKKQQKPPAKNIIPETLDNHNKDNNTVESKQHNDDEDESQSPEDSKDPNKTKKIKKEDKKPNKYLRKAAGYVWEDKTLADWDPNDYRLFCGNLGNEVTDEVLATAFRKYNSFKKAKVVRDKRTGKTKGYGFVALSSGKDFLACLSEMDGKYVGNRPVKLSRSSWKDRNLESEKNQELPSDFRTNSKKKTNQVNPNFMFTGRI